MSERIGDVLVSIGALKAEDLPRVAQRQATHPGRFATQVIALGLADERTVCRALARAQGLPAVVLGSSALDLEVLTYVPVEVARQHMILPLAVDETSITLAAADVDSRPIFEQVSQVAGRRVISLAAIDGVLGEAIEAAYAARERGERRWSGAAAKGTKPHLDVVRSVEGEAEQRVVGIVKGLSGSFARLRRTAAAQRKTPEPEVAEVEAPEEAAVAAAPPVMPAPEPQAPVRHEVPDGPLAVVVEDDDAIRMMVKKTLEKEGFFVLDAADGQAGMQLLRGHRPSIVVLDANLPGMHGFEICRRLKHSPSHQAIPVLIISAVHRGWQSAREAQEAHGANAFLEKPFQLQMLRRVVADLLGHAVEAAPVAMDRFEAIVRAQASVEAAKELQDWPAALAGCDEWLVLDPFDAIGHLERGNLLLQRGDQEGAMRAFESATVCDRDLYSAQVNLALVYDLLGFARKARERWHRAHDTAPDDKARAAISARFEERGGGR
jgi:CheY-like chemotaxis protein